MNIRKKFLQLTSMTYPHGTEEGVLPFLPEGLEKDGFGNYYLEIGEDYSTMFTSHLDTACGEQDPVNHRFTKDGNIVGTDGTTILGADCKAGVVIMMNMIEKGVPGLYYFFLGEEVGCKGSKWLSNEMFEGKMFEKHSITKVVSFDRKRTSSIITYQWEGRCASDAFADALIEEFKNVGMTMEKDTTGVCTDSIQFQDFIPECTNISVGYYDEHTGKERQDLEFLELISDAVTKIDWESLPAERDPSVRDYENFYGHEWGYGEWTGYGSGGSDQNLKTWHKDYTTMVKRNNEIVEVYLSLERIEYEKAIIRDILIEWGFGEDIETDEIDWNGNHLIISWDGENWDSLSRKDLKYGDKRLSTVPSEDIKVIEDDEDEIIIGV